MFIAKPFTDYTDEDYDAVAGVNLRGFFDISRSAIAAMLAHGGGGHLVSVDFTFTDRATLTVYLCVLIQPAPDGTKISHYQVSRLD